MCDDRLAGPKRTPLLSVVADRDDKISDFQPENFDVVISLCGCGVNFPKGWTLRELFEDWLSTIPTANRKALDLGIYFYYCGNIETLQRPMPKKQNLEQITRYADMLSAMGTESRLRIMQLLLSADPDGLVVGEIGNKLEIPSSTLSHHLEKLKNENLVEVRREGTFLWYSANTETLQELLGFLYVECCARNKAIDP